VQKNKSGNPNLKYEVFMQVHKKTRPESYEQFINDFHLDIPENFNFALDVVDAKAETSPDQPAMIHVNDQGVRREYDFKYFSSQSSRLANALRQSGIGKGDKVILILYKRVEFWVSMLALHKLGALAVPSPSLLTTKDIEYRVNFAGIKGAIIEDSAVPKVDAAREKCPEFTVLIQVGDSPPPTAGRIIPGCWKRRRKTSIRDRTGPGGTIPCLSIFLPEPPDRRKWSSTCTIIPWLM
jgi:acetyl-CoA synthetase